MTNSGYMLSNGKPGKYFEGLMIRKQENNPPYWGTDQFSESGYLRGRRSNYFGKSMKIDPTNDWKILLKLDELVLQSHFDGVCLAMNL